MNWETSDRRSRLPRDWPKRVTATKARADGMCEAQVHAPGCDGIGRECDHRINNDDHSLTNLQWLSTPCHKAKTQREAQAAKPKRRREPEPHPGRLT